MQKGLGHFHSDCVADFWRWWIYCLHTKGRPPRHNEVELPPLRRALANLWLVEWLPDSDTFRYRLVGDAVNKRFGTCLKGKTTAEVFSPVTRNRVDTAWRRILAQPAVAYQAGEIYPDGQSILLGERLATPLLDDNGQHLRFILGVTDTPPGMPEDHRTANRRSPDDRIFFPVDRMLVRRAVG